MTSVGLVVGASGGIGSACVRALAGSVERLVMTGRDEGRLAAAAPATGPGAQVVRADVAEPAGRAAILAAVDAPGAELRWVVIASGQPLRGRLADLAEADIEEALQANLVGPALLLRGLADAPWAASAALVVVGSISATRALASRSVYAASKAGIERLAMSLAAEWAPRGIRVTVVAAGVTDTPFLGPDHARLEGWAADHVPSGRMGRPEEVAEVVRYLCLEAPDYVVGARIVVDGGSEAIA